jgi:hypothetical protein
MASSLAKLEAKDAGMRKRWHAKAKAAMLREPDYFVWWYTVKSVALVAAIGAAAYYAGKASK